MFSFILLKLDLPQESEPQMHHLKVFLGFYFIIIVSFTFMYLKAFFFSSSDVFCSYFSRTAFGETSEKEQLLVVSHRLPQVPWQSSSRHMNSPSHRILNTPSQTRWNQYFAVLKCSKLFLSAGESRSCVNLVLLLLDKKDCFLIGSSACRKARGGKPVSLSAIRKLGG